MVVWFFVILALTASRCNGYPSAFDKRVTVPVPDPVTTPDLEDGQNSNTEEGDNMIVRLKLGDRDAWEEMGPTIVDAVREMIEEGVARSPVHALLILFWPDSTKAEHEQILARVEPLLQDSYDEFFAALNMTPNPDENDEREHQAEQQEQDQQQQNQLPTNDITPTSSSLNNEGESETVK